MRFLNREEISMKNSEFGKNYKIYERKALFKFFNPF